eukprot:m.902191 g.902191  ORF g.902191 m.902191 type:complete len:184 (-) comp23689_c3_seq38:1124-1675(-)
MWVWICYITHTETSFHALCVPCCCPHHLYATTNHPTATPPATPISIQECNTTVTVAPMHADTLKINPQAMRAALSTDMLATDLAYYLTRKAVPFREAHKLAGKAVAMAEEKDCALEDLTTNDYKSIHPKFDDDVAKVGLHAVVAHPSTRPCVGFRKQHRSVHCDGWNCKNSRYVKWCTHSSTY